MQRDMQNFLNEYTGDMILVTHSRDEAYKFCGHLTILDSGQALTTGETKKLFERPGILQAARLTGCKKFLNCTENGKTQYLCSGLGFDAADQRCGAG